MLEKKQQQISTKRFSSYSFFFEISEKLRGSGLLSVCQPLTFVFFEACRSFVSCGASEKCRFDFGSKLLISFWVSYWPTSHQNSSDAPCRIFLATTTLAWSAFIVHISETTLQLHPLCPCYLFKERNIESNYENWKWILFLTSFFVLLLMHLHLWVCYYISVLLNTYKYSYSLCLFN